MRAVPSVATVLGLVAALLGPLALTAVLVGTGGAAERDYVFLYLGLVVVLGVLRGLWPGLIAAALSFMLLDYFFVPPFHTLTIANEQDVVNLLAFAATAGAVGVLGSQRRRALLRAEALARDLRRTNAELLRLSREQAAAAEAALALAHSQEQVRALQEVGRLRRELLANVSHELRTPLGTILAESTAALAQDSDAEEAERRLRAIAGEAQRLRALVDDMMDMAVIEAGTLELRLEPLRLADVIEAAVERLRRISPTRAVDWDEAAADLDRSVTRAGIEVRLSPTEYALLAYLARHAGAVIDHRTLLREVWGVSHVHERNYLWTFVQRLRQKLEDDPRSPHLIVSAGSRGYRLGPPAGNAKPP